MKLLYIFLLFSFTACSQKKTGNSHLDKNKFAVTVKMDNLKKGDTVTFSYPEYKNGEPHLIEKNIIWTDGEMVLKGEISEPVEATLLRYTTEKVDTSMLSMLRGMDLPKDELDEIVTMLMNPRQPDMLNFLLVPGETLIQGKTRLSRANMTGNEAITAYDKLKKDFQAVKMKMSMKAANIYSLKTDSASRAQAMKSMDSIQSIVSDSIYLQYAIDHPSSQVALFALHESIPHKIDNADKYLLAFNKLSPDIQKWPWAQRIFHMLEAIRKTQVGNTIEDFVQQDSEGRKVKFSSFRGKYVLIELWASWCVPCRQKNPQLIAAYQQFSGKNFTILGVALEEKDAKNKWLAAVKKDGLLWPQLTDFKGWDNEVARQFGVRSIPFNILVDPDGKIIGKSLYDEELKTLLASVLK